VVCASVKSGVSDIKLTSVFCVGVYVTAVGFCIGCPVIVANESALKGEIVGLVSSM
jgi:hypothetical protein